MNFFEHQEKSKRNTAVLVALFSLAVSLIILAVYFVVMVVFFSSSADPGSTGSQPEIFIMVGLGVLMIIFGGSLFKSMALRRGGPYIAENLGGRRVNPATSDPDEKIHQCGGRNGHCRRHPGACGLCAGKRTGN
ncbi:MAG: hypothetical protein R2875_18880 [Desulfobacterales bacterium]